MFFAYDHNAVNMIDKFDVGAVLRSLGCVPTEKDIEEIVEKAEFFNHPGDIHITNFMLHLKKMLFQRKMEPSPPEEIQEAFKVFDPQNKGFIEKDIFCRMMSHFGEAMTDNELTNMMRSAVDPSDNRIYYESYISQLIHEPEDSIYKLAEKYARPDTRASQMKFNLFEKNSANKKI